MIMFHEFSSYFYQDLTNSQGELTTRMTFRRQWFPNRFVKLPELALENEETMKMRFLLAL